jgi:hypothetical protein
MVQDVRIRTKRVSQTAFASRTARDLREARYYAGRLSADVAASSKLRGVIWRGLPS